MRPVVTMILAFFVLSVSLQAFTAAVAQTSITAHKFKDDNRNGNQDADEDSLSDWPMALFSGPGCRSLIGEAATDGDGNAVFSVDSGSYSVGERFQPGWECTTGRCQDIEIDQDSITVFFGNYWVEDQEWK